MPNNMDIHDLRKVTDSVQDSLAGLVKNGQIVDYDATVKIGEETEIDVAYVFIKPLKFIKVDVKLSKPV